MNTGLWLFHIIIFLVKEIDMVKGIVNAALAFSKQHLPEILCGVACVGTAVSTYLAFKGGMNAVQRIESKTAHGDDISKKQMARIVMREAAPAAAAVALTWASIVSSGVISYRRAKAYFDAYILTSGALSTYRAKVVERLGEGKDEEIVGAIGQDLVDDEPPGSSDRTVVINTGHGNTLFKDRITGRYFRSDLDFIRKQQVEINNWLAAGEDWVSVNEWFGLIDLEQCEDLDDLGWNVEEKVKFDLAACLSPDNEPCILINYDISPRTDWRGFH